MHPGEEVYIMVSLKKCSSAKDPKIEKNNPISKDIGGGCSQSAALFM
jgi:hypothetical protein